MYILLWNLALTLSKLIAASRLAGWHFQLIFLTHTHLFFIYSKLCAHHRDYTYGTLENQFPLHNFQLFAVSHSRSACADAAAAAAALCKHSFEFYFENVCKLHARKRKAQM
jgi:hypothetical protein